MIGPVKNYLAQEDKSLEETTIHASTIAKLIALTDEGVISYGIAANKIFPHILNNPQTGVEEYIEAENLRLQNNDETDVHIEASLTKHAQKIAEYKKGKKGLLSLFVGEVMKLSKAKPMQKK